jgi:hypothetical protein
MQTPEQDTRHTESIQPDPGLQLSEGRASGIQITMVAIACMLIVSLMIYGLNRPATEDITASAPPAAQTTGAAPPPGEPAAQTGGNTAGGENVAPKGEAGPDQPAQQPVPQQTKPGVVEDDSKR